MADFRDFMAYIEKQLAFDRLPCGSPDKPHVSLVFAGWAIEQAKAAGVDVSPYNVCARCLAPHPFQIIDDVVIPEP